MSVAGKLYGRVPIKRVRARTECVIGEEQCMFRQGRGCMDQVFAVRQVFEKYLANATLLCGLSIVRVVREMNVMVLGKGLELPSANGSWFELNQLLFEHDTAVTALVAD